jgi:hypothetical protein
VEYKLLLLSSKIMADLIWATTKDSKNAKFGFEYHFDMHDCIFDLEYICTRSELEGFQ